MAYAPAAFLPFLTFVLHFPRLLFTSLRHDTSWIRPKSLLATWMSGVTGQASPPTLSRSLSPLRYVMPPSPGFQLTEYLPGLVYPQHQHTRS